MTWYNKVVWAEGMFLKPQHFQQQDRYLEKYISNRCDHIRPYNWGVLELELDQEALELGKVAIVKCSGVLPDGTPVNIPSDDEPPPVLELADECADSLVFLALPVKRPGTFDTDNSGNPSPNARQRAEELEVIDNNHGSQSLAAIEIGRRSLRLLLEQDDHSQYVKIPLTRIIEKRDDDKVILDEAFIPPCVDCKSISILNNFIGEISGLLRQRATALAGRVSESGRGGAAEIADFLLLQLVNRYSPWFSHLHSVSGLHPVDLFEVLVQLSGEMATFTQNSKLGETFPPYVHDDLQKSFAPVMLDIRQSLSMVLEQTAIQLPLEERGYGISVALITDRSLLDSADFLLAVKADVPPDTVRRGFPSQVKIGPAEQIRQLVNLQLPGIAIRALPVAPRQIPYHAGLIYFELDRSGDYWKELQQSGGFAFHVGDQFPGLEMAFWVIKR